MTSSPFPLRRMRRLRAKDALRGLVAEHRLTTDDLIYPVFVLPGDNAGKPYPLCLVLKDFLLICWFKKPQIG